MNIRLDYCKKRVYHRQRVAVERRQRNFEPLQMTLPKQMKRITISDVARHAGVSTGTVSAVLNRRTTVRAQTRSRVEQAIASLGYEPSLSARQLGSGRRDNQVFERGIGLVIKEMDNPFYTEVVIGARNLLTERGYLAFVTTSEGDYAREGHLVQAMRNRFLHGAIVAPVLHEQANLAHLFQLHRAQFPFVLLESVPGLKAPSVSIDNVVAAQRAATFLLEQGHKRLVHFAGPSYTLHSRERIQGFRRAFSDSQLRFQPESIVPAGAHMDDGYQAALAYFQAISDEKRPTAVTCFNDLVAMGVMRALTECGLRIPEDVSIIGCDDIPAAAYLQIPLTTVRAPTRALGKRAAELLIEQIEQAEPSTPHRVLLDASLVVRGSTTSLSSDA